MPSKDPVQRFEDILENIALIQQFTAGMDLAAFMEDLKTYAAVERCLERLSEASKKLGEVAEELCPGIPWPEIRGLGNLLRHEYDRIEGFRLWYVVEDDLAPLQAAVTAALQKLRE
ncbi:MAG: HepT-like ribonuclease domain-containing protein [Bryobacteraceae bacterium]